MNPIVKWINMLRGKPAPVQQESSSPDDATKADEVQKVQDQTTPGEEQKFYFADEGSSEDSVAKDLKLAGDVAKSALEKVKKVPLPKPRIFNKGKGLSDNINKTAEKVQNAGILKKLSNELLGKAIRIVVIISLSAILIFVLFSLFRLFEGRVNLGNGGVDVVQNGDTPTPTPVSYRPYEPSVYAEDPEVQQIEENLSILDAEVFRANIGDSAIKPPTLDFNISF